MTTERRSAARAQAIGRVFIYGSLLVLACMPSAIRCGA